MVRGPPLPRTPRMGTAKERELKDIFESKGFLVALVRKRKGEHTFFDLLAVKSGRIIPVESKCRRSFIVTMMKSEKHNWNALVDKCNQIGLTPILCFRIITDYNLGLSDEDKWHWFIEPTAYTDKGYPVFVWGEGKPLSELFSP